MSIREFDRRDVSLVVDGQVVTGYAEGTFITCAKEEDTYTSYVGAQGEVTRARNAHPLGTITITLQATSPSNTLLSRLARQRETFPVRVVDRNSPGATIGGSEAWVQKPANLEFAAEVSGREWTIVVADYEAIIQ